MLPFLQPAKLATTLLETRNDEGERTSLEEAPPLTDIATSLPEVTVDMVDTRPIFEYSDFLKRAIVRRIMGM